ncbi:MAG: beta-propeller fold lactonase family protein [Hydrogenophaga sp.]|nr:beta-propeller fold lactonase family protein [Hydrogenophaga sp.]
MRHTAHFGGVGYPQFADMLALHAAIGPDLMLMRVDRDDLSLHEVSRLNLPAPVQYVWPHPSRNLLYVACSNRPISRADDLHVLATVAVDEHDGAMRLLVVVPLPTRPIHLTLDAQARHALVVYNAPARITAHALDANGLAGEVLPQTLQPHVGVFPHQVLMLPSGQAAVVVARGNHAVPGRDEQPGSFEFLSLEGGRLTHRASVAPGGGKGFGPRHLAFHPAGRWAAVSVERHNELHIYAVDRDRFASEPTWRLSTLGANAAAHSHDQLSGTVRFHPGGCFLYVVNRHDTAVYGDGSVPCDPEGNNIAVFSFDASDGQPRLLQHAPTDSVHVRTISLDASGDLLVAASILPALVSDGDTVRRVPARLSFLRVGKDGWLSLARVQDMDNERLNLFWSHLNGTVRAG